MTTAAPALRLATSQGRWVVAAAVLGSAVAMLTGTVVNVALPAIAGDLGADTTGVQWILNSYLLTLAALILLGGGLGDRYGRRRIFVWGTVVFAVASAACAAAPTLGLLLAARALQGVGAALLTPVALALLEASFVKEDRSAAIGAWSGLGGVAAAVGPLLGGLLLEVAGWRLLFLVNLPVCLAAVAIAVRHVPETRDDTVDRRLDVPGAVTGVVALAGITYGGIQLGAGLTTPVAAAFAVGLAAAVAFVLVEHRSPAPLVPPGVFTNRQFAATNVLTFVVYAALSAVFFLLVVYLQVVLGFSPLEAGAATLPATGLLLVGSSRAGRLATRIGPRLPLTVGSVLLAAGMLLYARLGPDSGYAPDVLTGVVVFGCGLVLLVAPVTAAVLAAADERHAGVASGINNAVARVAGLLAVAVLPVAAGLGGADLGDAALLEVGFSRAMTIAAALALTGAVLAWTTVDPALTVPEAPAEQHYPHEQPACYLEHPAPAVRLTAPD